MYIIRAENSDAIWQVDNKQDPCSVVVENIVVI